MLNIVRLFIDVEVSKTTYSNLNLKPFIFVIFNYIVILLYELIWWFESKTQIR